MALLKRIEEMTFSVTWTLLLIGWEGPGKVGRVVTVEEIVAHATIRLEMPSSNDTFEVAQLASATESDTTVIASALRKLSMAEGASSDVETRKWRYVLLEQLVQNLPADPLYGLIALTTFWSQFDFPT